MQNSLFTLALGGMLTLGMTGAAVAQDNTAPPPEQGQQQGRGPWRMDPDRQLDRLTRQLSLTAEQQSQIKPLLVDRQQKMQALFQEQSLSREDRRARAETIASETKGKIEAVLNDQQKQKYEAMQERMRHGGGNGEGAPAGGSAPPQ
jgi:hypothetical protein